MRTAINLYSVRELDESTLDIVDRVAAAGYDGIQFSGGFGDATAADAAAAVTENGLAVAPPHFGIDELEGDLDSLVETAIEPLGATGVVVPYLDEEHFASREAIVATADRLEALAASLDASDLDLHYHNHAHEFTTLDDTTGLEALIESTESVAFELDVGWVHTGGHDPVDLIERYGDRISVLHMKDMADGEFREIGDGDVDMAACAEAGRAAGCEWLIYEHDQPADPARSLDTGASFLAELA